MQTRVFRTTLLARALLCAALTAPLTAQAGLFDSETLFGPSEKSRIAQWEKDPTKKLTWGDWEFVRLEKRDDGRSTGNQHPVQLNPDAVAATLERVQVKPYKEVLPLFAEEEIKKLAPAIASALAKAGPDQDLVFILNGQHGILGPLAPVASNVGRAFFADGRLNLLLGMTHSDFIAESTQGTRQAPKLEYGSRTRESSRAQIVGVTEGDAKLLRKDWIALTVPSIAAPAPAAGRAVAGAAAGAAVAAPVAADPGMDPHYRKQESRLKAIQRLKDQGLITEAEFQQKRTEILKDL